MNIYNKLDMVFGAGYTEVNQTDTISSSLMQFAFEWYFKYCICAKYLIEWMNKSYITKNIRKDRTETIRMNILFVKTRRHYGLYVNFSLWISAIIDFPIQYNRMIRPCNGAGSFISPGSHQMLNLSRLHTKEFVVLTTSWGSPFHL